MSDQEESDYDSCGESSDNEPTYTPTEIADMFLDFYKFLTTLHFDPADLKIPPEECWGQLIPDSFVNVKSQEVVDVLRRLPYLRRDNEPFYYSSYLIDYTTFGIEALKYRDSEMQYLEIWSHDRGEIVDQSLCIYIALGYESGGLDFVLNVVDAEVTDDVLEHNQGSPDPLQCFFDRLKEELTTLKYIPCEGMETLDVSRVPERYEEVTDGEIYSQTERTHFPSDLEAQYIRQLYRRYGWPNAFRRAECFNAVMEWTNALKERGLDYWPSVFHTYAGVSWALEP